MGIFGEGTDSPSLSAVAFLEPRKSPIDVVQAVGRAMRTAPGKNVGYIICPIWIPPDVDPELWLSSSQPREGWEILGGVLRALRAHDRRIEDELPRLLCCSLPKPPKEETTLVAMANSESREIDFGVHIGPVGHAKDVLEMCLEKNLPLESQSKISPLDTSNILNTVKPVYLLAGKKHEDGSSDLREGLVVTDTPRPGESVGKININKTKALAQRMINNAEGRPAVDRRRIRKSNANRSGNGQLSLLEHLCEEYGKAIRVNLLSKSGIARNRIERDANLLEEGVRESAIHLRDDGLTYELNRHFGLNHLKEESLAKQADGCMTASLLMMNAAMLHQRICDDRWMDKISNLSDLKSSVDVVREIELAWMQIMVHDFKPVLEPAVDCIRCIRKTGKLVGLERALHRIASDAERIAEMYADIGSDHAGPLFNRVMGNQASDGAYFTRPTAACIAARLTLDSVGVDLDWRDSSIWEKYKIVDLACGSGTLLTAMLTEMKRRAKKSGASESFLAYLQKLAVEKMIKGLDINPISLQLAASQLTTGSRSIRYKRMGLHLMPYGPSKDGNISIGSLELLHQRRILPSASGMHADGVRQSELVWEDMDDPKIEDAVEAVSGAQIVIMNPPFTNRNNMGQKFPKETQKRLRGGVDWVHEKLIQYDSSFGKSLDKNSIGPMFSALADLCLDDTHGVLTLILPTIALTSSSNYKRRKLLAQHYHIHTIVSSHEPKQWNMSVDTGINESLIICRRHRNGHTPPTKFIHLDRMPTDESQVNDLHCCLLECKGNVIPKGWGSVTEWPVDRIAGGDWTLAIWRSAELAEAAARFAESQQLLTLETLNLTPHDAGRQLRGSFKVASADTPGSFPILKSKGADGQKTIRSSPDEYWAPKNPKDSVSKILQKSGYLLITAGQNNSTARLTATASTEKYVGNSWMPVTGLSSQEAKAAAVFLNSTPGRLQIMREPGKNLVFPGYSVASAIRIRIPDIREKHIQETLANCWEVTENMTVPQFRDGECVVRRLWDEAVADVLEWSHEDLTGLRELLHREPHVRGLGRNQYK